MPSLAAVKGMLKSDGLRLVRDRFLLGMFVYILGISVAIRLVLPFVTSELATRVEFDLLPYYPLLVSHVVIQLAPAFAGMIGGFLLLESREDRTIRALMVSPVSVPAYIATLGAALGVVAVALTAVESAIIATALPGWPALCGAAVAGAPIAVLVALFISSLADDKTQAFAYMKVCAMFPVVASAAYFIPEPWQWLATVYPPYWASKAYWVAEAGSNSWPLWALGGLLVSAFWVVLMARLFVRAAHR